MNLHGYDEWYEPDPPIMLGSAYSVSSESWEQAHRPVGFIWPKADPRGIVLATANEIIKYGKGSAE